MEANPPPSTPPHDQSLPGRSPRLITTSRSRCLHHGRSQTRRSKAPSTARPQARYPSPSRALYRPQASLIRPGPRRRPQPPSLPETAPAPRAARNRGSRLLRRRGGTSITPTTTTMRDRRASSSSSSSKLMPSSTLVVVIIMPKKIETETETRPGPRSTQPARGPIACASAPPLIISAVVVVVVARHRPHRLQDGQPIAGRGVRTASSHQPCHHHNHYNYN